MDKMRMESQDLTQANIDKIAEIFPGALTEAKDENGKLKKAVNFDILKQLLSSDVVDGDEAYEFTWVGKKASIVEAGKPIRKTLRPCKAESKNWESTENLYIEGDNLDVLKLLQESYLGKVKMIYIDPPYNTGNDFIYRDNFTMDKDDYDEETGVYDEDGDKLFRNTESNGRFHSDWCSMMYPHLKLASSLLANDGVIFISIDDSEAANLKHLLDEIFGGRNFIDTIAIEMSTTSGPKTVNAQQGTIVKNVEFVHVYKKNIEFDKAPHIPLLDGIDSYDSHYTIWLNEDGTLGNLAEQLMKDKNVGDDIRRFELTSRGTFSIKNIDKLLSLSDSASTFILNNLEKIARIDRPPVSAIEKSTPVGRWEPFEVAHRVYFLTTLANGSLQALMPLSLNFRMSDDYKPRFGRTVIRGDLWKGFHQDMGNVAKEGGIAFANGQKPIRLIKQLIKWANNSDDAIVLDFFSGSATTAHAVMQLNAEDGGNRKFIMVQLQEECAPDSEAAKAGYANICEIGKERIRRAGEKIKADNVGKDGIENLDIGFRVLKLDSTNMKDVYYGTAEYDQGKLTDLISNIKDDRDDMDLLHGCLLEWGLLLSLPHTSEEVGGIAVHTYNNGDLIACFAPKVSETVVREIAGRKPLRVVFRDSSFADAPAKINVAEIFKLMAPNTTIKVL